MRSDRVTRTARELVLVIIGVLLALGAQAQWEKLQARKDRRAYVDAILVELEVNRERVQQLADFADAALAATDSTLSVAYGESEYPGGSRVVVQG